MLKKKSKTTLIESKYNNLFLAPETVESYKSTYEIIKAIYSLNNHVIDKRFGNVKGNNTSINTDILFSFIFVETLPILLHINTNYRLPILDTFPLMDTMLLSKIPISTIIDSVCRDTLLLPFLVGKKRYMYKNAHIYFTTNFYEAVSNSSIEDKMNNLSAINNKILAIFKKYTKLPPEIYKILFKREIFLNADDCLKYGIVDYIV